MFLPRAVKKKFTFTNCCEYYTQMSRVILSAFALVFLQACISPSVYFNHPHDAQKSDEKIFEVKMEGEDVVLEKQRDPAGLFLPSKILITGTGPYIAYRSPCLFFAAKRKLKNRYGHLGQLIADEMNEYPHLYFSTDTHFREISIHVSFFEIKSNDSCFANRVKGSFEATARGLTHKGITIDLMDFKSEYMVKSWVTELYLVSVLWTIPTLIHSGFMGNRQDQINEVGAYLLADFSKTFRKALLSPPGKIPTVSDEVSLVKK